jgi:hypothetical protein
MRKFLTAVLVAATLAAGQANQASAAERGPWRGPCSGWHNGENDDGATPLATRQRHTENLVDCAFAWIGESVPYAEHVADRESHYCPSAYNPSGSAGVFQHQMDYWLGRLREYMPRSWIAPYLRDFATRWRSNVFDPYLNVWVAAFMVRRGGWGPWASPP